MSKKEELKFLQQQLWEAKQALAYAKTVRQLKFLENKIKYLTERVKELQGEF